VMLRALVRWKMYLGVIVEAVARAAPGARAYLTGGAAEGRLTALSDVDVVVVLQLHIVGPESAKRYRVLIPLAHPSEGA